MNLIGSKSIETERLLILPQTMKEQKRLWEILCLDEVNKYYLTIPKKARERFKDWEIQEPYYRKKIEPEKTHEVFQWSLFLKENNDCIGQISVHEANIENETIQDQAIRGIGWFIDPKYQGYGYMTEAAQKILDYMFNEVNISEIRTGAAVLNPASWKVMEKIGFLKRSEKTHFVEYTFLNEPVEAYSYGLTKEEYLNFTKEIANKSGK